MPDHSGAIHVAVVAALVNAPALAAIVGARVYDSVPQETTYPFCQVTVETGEPYDGVRLDGWECLVRVDHWSRNGGRVQEAHEMAAASYGALHNAEIAIAGVGFVHIRLLPGGQRIVRETDDRTIEAIQRFRVVAV